jgi:hypothetical protein
MPLISKTISNLIGGISQQASEIRLEGQCEDTVNGIPSLVEGWKKRKGTRHIARLANLSDGDVNYHFDDNKLITVKNGIIRVYDLLGNLKTVYGDNADGYLNASDLIFTTIADTTFILNPHISPAMAGDVNTDPYPNRGVIHVKQVNWNTTYQILNSGGTVLATLTSPDGVVDPNVDSGTTVTYTCTGISGITITRTTSIEGGSVILVAPGTSYIEGRGDNQTTETYVAGQVRIKNTNLYYCVGTGYTTADLASAINSRSVDMTALLKATTALPATGTFPFTASGSSSGEADDADTKWMDFSYIASALAAQISGASAVKNTIFLPAGSYSVTDSQNGQYLIYINGKVSVFADLPLIAPNGFTVEITNGTSSSSGNYYVRAITKDGSAFGDCYWEECAEPGLSKSLNGASMPHKLLHNSNDTYTYSAIDWDKRIVGDEYSNPTPSFIGKAINDVFYYKNRLGLLAGENVSLSRASEPFAFFMSTVQTLADNEPIDAAGSHHSTVILKHALPLSEKLYMFGNKAQFVLDEGDSILSPKTASVSTLTEYESDTAVSPVSSGKSIYFPAKNESFESLYEGLISDDTFRADSVTSHVSALIPANIDILEASPNAEMLIIHSRNTPNTLYLYKSAWSGTEKVQSAWMKETFRGVIRAAWYDNTTLYIVSSYSDGMHLESLNFDEGNTDTEICLDRKCTATKSGNNYIMPYSILADTDTPVILLPDGQIIKTKRVDATTVTPEKDITVATATAGFLYDATLTMSQFIFIPSGQKIALTQGRLQIRNFWLNFKNADTFTVNVTPIYRETKINRFNGIIGAGESVLGERFTADGRYNIPVMSRNTQTEIVIHTDSVRQLCLINGGWEGYYVCRSDPS